MSVKPKIRSPKTTKAPDSARAESTEAKIYSKGAQRILITAEKLFGEHGINGVSMRQILADADHANKAGVYHHFGSKEGLLLAVFDMRIPLIEKARNERLRDAEQRGPVGVKELLEALLLPFVSIHQSASARRACAQFHLQIHLHFEGHHHPSERWSSRSPAAIEITDRLRKQLAHLPDEIFRSRFKLVIGFVLTGIAKPDRDIATKARATEGAFAYEDDLIRMATAALQAPWQSD